MSATVGASDVQRLGARLAVLEAERGWSDGAVRIMAEIASPAGILALDTLVGASPRLAGLIWDGAVLARALGLAATDRPQDDDGSGLDFQAAAPLLHGRARVVLVAAAAGIPAFDATASTYEDADVFAVACERARRDGFAGCVATRPEQVAAVERLFGRV